MAIKMWYDSNATAQQRNDIRQEIMTLAVRTLSVGYILLAHAMQCSPRGIPLPVWKHSAWCRGVWLHVPIECAPVHDPVSTSSKMPYVQGLRHPNIVTLCGACWDASNTLMVSELMPFNLFDILYKMGSVTLQTVNCIKIGIDICRAFRYLHSRTPQIIHRCMCLPMHWLSAFPNDLSPPKSNLIEH